MATTVSLMVRVAEEYQVFEGKITTSSNADSASQTALAW